MQLNIEIPYDPDIELRERVKSILNQTLNPCFDFLSDNIRRRDASVIQPFTFSTHTDYSDPLVRSFYILKYFYAYLFEFIEIFQLLFKEVNRINTNNRNINIVSFGSGCLVDLIALAIMDPALISDVSIKYFGFDTENWEMTIKNLPSNIDYRFIEGNFFETINNDEYFSIDEFNIFISPNSIDDAIQDLGSLKSFINEKLFQSRACSIITTFPKAGSPGFDINVYQSFFLLLDSVLNTKINFQYRTTIKNQKSENLKVGITTIDRNFPVYPDNLKDKLTNAKIERMCPKYCVRGNHCDKRSNECKDDKKPIPILTYKYINYRIEVYSNDH